MKYDFTSMMDRKGKDAVFANERKVRSWDEIFEEADSMDAEGTGITGGDPLECMDRTLRAVRMLKERYGPGHHIHLYTATIDPERVRMLEEAGLDEIRDRLLVGDGCGHRGACSAGHA